MNKKVEDFSDFSDKVEDWYNGRVMEEVNNLLKADSELEWNSKELALEGTFVNYEELYNAYKTIKIMYKQSVKDMISYLESLECKKKSIVKLLRESPVEYAGFEHSEGLIIDSMLDIMDDIKEEVLYEINMEIKQVMYHNLSDSYMEMVNRQYCEDKGLKYESKNFEAEIH